jgi:hypothetical protein
MNRDEIPPGYVRCVEHMAAAARAWLADHPGERPTFRFPPKGVMVAAPLDQGAPLVCTNEPAHALVAFVELASASEGTVFQLGIALELAGVDVERVTLEAFTRGLGSLHVVTRGGRS